VRAKEAPGAKGAEPKNRERPFQKEEEAARYRKPRHEEERLQKKMQGWQGGENRDQHITDGPPGTFNALKRSELYGNERGDQAPRGYFSNRRCARIHEPEKAKGSSGFCKASQMVGPCHCRV